MKANIFAAFLAGVFVTLVGRHFFEEKRTQTEKIEPVAATCDEHPPVVQEKIVYKCQDDESTVLQAPQFKATMPPILTTNREGEAQVQWQEVDHAKSYQLKVYDLKGRLVKTWNTKRTIFYIKQLPYDEDLEFTPYKISLVALNKSDVAGEESEQRDLQVRRMKNIMAPHIEAITIED